ncbi:MAG: asparagine synthase-related protein [Thermoprotei archaeon]
MHDASTLLRKQVAESVQRMDAEAIALSGGLDTTIVALCAQDRSLSAYTVALEEADAPDVGYARKVASMLGLTHTVKLFGFEEYMEAVRCVTEIMHSFDPMEIRNSSAVYLAFRKASEDGYSSIYTGDGADELFAGYSYLYNIEDLSELRAALERLWAVMRFSAVRMAESLNMKAVIPYLSDNVVGLARRTHPSLLVGFNPLTGLKTGKYVLRKAFEKDLPEQLVWRTKTPIEVGCGTTSLPSLFERKITDDEYSSKRKEILEADRVKIRSKEHLAYYLEFRRLFDPPSADETDQRRCPDCGAPVHGGGTFCVTCGAYPV